MTRPLLIVLIVCGLTGFAVFAQPQAPAPIQRQSGDVQELASILENEGEAKRRIAALERFIRDNPDSPALPQAYRE